MTASDKSATPVLLYLRPRLIARTVPYVMSRLKIMTVLPSKTIPVPLPRSSTIKGNRPTLSPNLRLTILATTNPWTKVITMSILKTEVIQATTTVTEAALVTVILVQALLPTVRATTTMTVIATTIAAPPDPDPNPPRDIKTDLNLRTTTGTQTGIARTTDTGTTANVARLVRDPLEDTADKTPNQEMANANGTTSDKTLHPTFAPTATAESSIPRTHVKFKRS